MWFWIFRDWNCKLTLHCKAHSNKPNFTQKWYNVRFALTLRPSVRVRCACFYQQKQNISKIIMIFVFGQANPQLFRQQINAYRNNLKSYKNNNSASHSNHLAPLPQITASSLNNNFWWFRNDFEFFDVCLCSYFGCCVCERLFARWIDRTSMVCSVAARFAHDFTVFVVEFVLCPKCVVFFFFFSLPTK